MEQSINIPRVEQQNTNTPQTIIIQQTGNKNGLGLTGFIMSITGLFLCWVPILSWLLLVPSFLLSFIGQFRKPRTLAVIGAILSGLIIFIKLLLKASFWGGLMSLSML